MYAACFEISGWTGKQLYLFSGNKLQDVADELMKVQDLNCLLNMGWMSEHNENGFKSLEWLGKFMNRYNTEKLYCDDIVSFNVQLSAGSIKCLEMLKSKNAINVLQEKYPDAFVY